MKLYAVAFFLAVLVSGCSTLAPDKNIIREVRVAPGGYVSLQAKKTDENNYVITAFGSKEVLERHVVAGWNWMAEKVAAGRPSEKERTAGEEMEYDLPASDELMRTVDSVGTKVTGRLLLK